jgi:hypothetical protein
MDNVTSSSNNTREATQGQPPSRQAVTSSAAQHPNPYYSPSLPLPPHPLQALSSDRLFGFFSPAETPALNLSIETFNASPTLPLLGNTPAYIAAYTSLAATENLFRDLDPALDARRLHNIVGGWVAMDGSEAPEPEKVNWLLEPESIRIVRLEGMKRRGKRGEKSVRNRRVYASRGPGRFYGAFEDTEEVLLEGEENKDFVSN